jgi:ribosomal protein L16 Arg81 hydroxylase
MQTNTLSSETVEHVTRNEFHAGLLARKLPVVIKDGLADWKAVQTWSPDYLASVLGDRPVRVAVAAGHKYDYNATNSSFDQLTQFRKDTMPFSAFAAKVQKPGPAGEHYYLMQRPIRDDFPELLPDIRIPAWIEGRKMEINLWMGSQGNVTQMHYDRSENFLAEVHGRKHVRLFDPGQTELLYPYPRDSVMYYLSYVDCDNPDFERYPEFRKARPLEFVLEPGELLYLPAGWWHQVRSLDVAISVNFWWTD